MLIVDDQESVRGSLEYLLGISGYRVIGAKSGAEAIELATQHCIDGALIDVHMPGMNGFDTCLRLQAQARPPGEGLRVWFMTAAFTKSFDRRSEELGALGVLKKPFSQETLVERLELGFASAPPICPPATSKMNDEHCLHPAA